MQLPAALERTLYHIRWELRAIARAPVTFGVSTLVMAVLIFLGIGWYHRAETDQLRRQLAEYRNKLGGASADQAKRALDMSDYFGAIEVSHAKAGSDSSKVEFKIDATFKDAAAPSTPSSSEQGDN